MIYADNAATTRISDLAFEKMLPFLCQDYGNASSQYLLGVKAKRAIELARKQVSSAIGADESEITFTSGGSEANAWVIGCIAQAYRKEPIHIITTSIEHPSVINTCRALEHIGIEVSYLPVDVGGRILFENFKAEIKDNTKLVSIMLANNEIGTIEPIAEIGKILRRKGIAFHTDAVQAVGHIPLNVRDLHVDFLTASAHKFNGAKGAGFLYKRCGLELSPLIFGGKQERGLRAGTENVAAIVSMGYAIEESIEEMEAMQKRLRKMVEATIKGIKDKISSARINGNRDESLPGIVNLSFGGVSGSSLMHLLDLKGICISTASACSSGKDEPSHVLLALGLSEQEAKSAIRISYGRYNTFDEVDTIVAAVCDAYSKIIAMR